MSFQQSLEYNCEIIDSALTFLCKNCGRKATLRCEKTKLCYCSLTCESRRPDVVIPIQPNQIIFSDAIKVKDKVVITAIINERCIFISPKDFDEVNLMNSVRKLAQRSMKLEMLPEVGDLVLAWYLGDVFRAKVLAVPDDGLVIPVQLIDYGNTANIQFDDLMEMDQDCQRIKCKAHRVFLKDVPHIAVNNDIARFLLHLLEQKTELVVTALEDDEITLVDKSKVVNISEKIVALSKVADATNSSAGVSLQDVS